MVQVFGLKNGGCLGIIILFNVTIYVKISMIIFPAGEIFIKNENYVNVAF